MTDEATHAVPSGEDPFERLGAAASRVLRAAMEGSAALRAHREDVDEALRTLETSIARILREAEAAAAAVVAEARRQATFAPGAGEEDRRPAPEPVRLRPDERIVLRRRPPDPGSRGSAS